MALSVHLDRNPNRLRFEEFPTASLDFREKIPKEGSSFVHVKVMDVQTKKITSVFLEAVALQKIGISLTAWENISHDCIQLSALIQSASVIECLLQRAIPTVSDQLSPSELTFFTDTAYANRVICCALHKKVKHLSGIQGVPGIYFHCLESSVNIFINLKKTPPLGSGAYGKVRKVLWLNPPQHSPRIVAKKVLTGDVSADGPYFKREMAALREFPGKRGIISLIANGAYDDKYAIFMPCYESNLFQCLCQPRFPLSLNEILNVASQWLDGLATISEKGIHGDIGPQNLLLRRSRQGIEGVIADLGSYRPYDRVEYGLTTITFAPPEYYKEKIVTPQHDVWGMGICLHEIFSEEWLRCWKFSTKSAMKLWTSELTPGWVLKYPTRADTPPFLLNLINEMLDPRVDHRPTAGEAFERFLSGYSSFIDRSSEQKTMTETVDAPVLARSSEEP